MFGRGNWAIVGLAKESLEAFKASLEDRGLMIAVSQLAASAVTRHSKVDAVGINPFSTPRLDEQHPITLDKIRNWRATPVLSPMPAPTQACHRKF